MSLSSSGDYPTPDIIPRKIDLSPSNLCGSYLPGGQELRGYCEMNSRCFLASEKKNLVPYLKVQLKGHVPRVQEVES